MNTYCFKGPETQSSSRPFLQVLLLILKLIHKKQIKHLALNYLNANYLFYEFKKRNRIWPTFSDFPAPLAPRTATMNVAKESQFHCKTKQDDFSVICFQSSIPLLLLISSHNELLLSLLSHLSGQKHPAGGSEWPRSLISYEFQVK